MENLLQCNEVNNFLVANSLRFDVRTDNVSKTQVYLNKVDYFIQSIERKKINKEDYKHAWVTHRVINKNETSCSLVVFTVVYVFNN